MYKYFDFKLFSRKHKVWHLLAFRASYNNDKCQVLDQLGWDIHSLLPRCSFSLLSSQRFSYHSSCLAWCFSYSGVFLSTPVLTTNERYTDKTLCFSSRNSECATHVPFLGARGHLNSPHSYVGGNKIKVSSMYCYLMA